MGVAPSDFTPVGWLRGNLINALDRVGLNTRACDSVWAGLIYQSG